MCCTFGPTSLSSVQFSHVRFWFQHVRRVNRSGHECWHNHLSFLARNPRHSDHRPTPAPSRQTLPLPMHGTGTGTDTTTTSRTGAGANAKFSGENFVLHRMCITDTGVTSTGRFSTPTSAAASFGTTQGGPCPRPVRSKSGALNVEFAALVPRTIDVTGLQPNTKHCCQATVTSTQGVLPGGVFPHSTANWE